MPRVTLTVPAPPVQPQPQHSLDIIILYFCVIGPGKKALERQIAVFDNMLPGCVFTTMHADRIASQYNTIYIPVDPFTVVRLGAASWEDLGYPEVTEAYTKLLSIG